MSPDSTIGARRVSVSGINDAKLAIIMIRAQPLTGSPYKIAGFLDPNISIMIIRNARNFHLARDIMQPITTHRIFIVRFYLCEISDGVNINVKLHV